MASSIFLLSSSIFFKRASTVCETHTCNVDFSEPRSYSASVSEPHTRGVNMNESQTLSTTVSDPRGVVSVKLMPICW